MIIEKNVKDSNKPSAPPKCQKCLEAGHWTYECKGKRKFLHRSSRTSLLNKKLKTIEEKGKDNNLQMVATGFPKKVIKSSKNSNSSSSSSSSNSSGSSSDSTSSSSSEESSSSSSSSSEESSDSE